MEPADKMEPRAWMRSPAVRSVIEALTVNGPPARFVGGCVRDMLLERDVNDVDIATPLRPEEVMRRLRKAQVRGVPTGIEHGTVTAVVNDPKCPFSHFEITTLRADVETDGRRATVAFIDDWAADAARRDFTINALYCDSDGTIYDPVGGLEDLKARRVRFVGDPARRIDEDVLRLLRFFRFQAVYGRAPADRAALSACTEWAPLLPTLAGERVAHELLRLLGAQDPAPVLSLMAGQGILKFILPEALVIDRLAALVPIEERSVGGDPLRRLAAMLKVDEGGAVEVAERLRLSKARKSRLAAMAEIAPDLGTAVSQPQRRALLYRLGKTAFVDSVLLAWADEVARGTAQDRQRDETWQSLLALPGQWSPPVLPIRGGDVRALGVARGPAVGQVLRAVEKWWIAGDFSADRDGCLAWLGELLAQDA